MPFAGYTPRRSSELLTVSTKPFIQYSWIFIHFERYWKSRYSASDYETTHSPRVKRVKRDHPPRRGLHCAAGWIWPRGDLKTKYDTDGGSWDRRSTKNNARSPQGSQKQTCSHHPQMGFARRLIHSRRSLDHSPHFWRVLARSSNIVNK